MQQEQELLDALAERADCRYLSDLHRAELRTEILAAVNSIPAETYPDGAWGAALSYIAGSGENAAPGEARSALIAYLTAG